MMPELKARTAVSSSLHREYAHSASEWQRFAERVRG